MIRLQAVIFDYGNVLCQPQRSTDLDEMAEACEIEPGEFETLYWKFRDKYDQGAHDAVDYWTAIGKAAKRHLTKEQIDKGILLDNIGWSRPNPPMVEWAQRLRTHGVKTAILSNMPLELRQYITQREWLPAFDHSVYSCDAGYIKPCPEIYLHCLELLGLNAEDTLFIDDRLPNVQAAQRLGMHAVTFSDHGELHTVLHEKFDLPLPLAR